MDFGVYFGVIAATNVGFEPTIFTIVIGLIGVRVLGFIVIVPVASLTPLSVASAARILSGSVDFAFAAAYTRPYTLSRPIASIVLVSEPCP